MSTIFHFNSPVEEDEVPEAPWRRSMQVRSTLTRRGYRRSDRPYAVDSRWEVNTYYRRPLTHAGRPVSACLQNDRAPQIWVVETYIEPPVWSTHPPVHSFRIGLRNLSPVGWLDTHFYALDADRLRRQLAELESGLLAMWEALFTPLATLGNQPNQERS